jgi:hypothetical protein
MDWGQAGLRRQWIDYLRANSAARVPEGIDDCLKRMSITAMIAGPDGANAAAPGLTSMETSATPVGADVKRGILDRMRGR